MKYKTEEERKQAHREAYKRWYEKHKVERAAYQKQWREQNPEYMKQWCDEHKAEQASYQKKYISTHFGRAVMLAKGYCASDKKAGRGKCSIDAHWIINNVFSGQVCHYCGESDWTKLGVDRKDSSLPHTPDNCVPCCDACNKKKRTTTYEEFLQKIK